MDDTKKAESQAITTSCEALDALPDDAVQRVMLYLMTRYLNDGTPLIRLEGIEPKKCEKCESDKTLIELIQKSNKENEAMKELLETRPAQVFQKFKRIAWYVSTLEGMLTKTEREVLMVDFPDYAGDATFLDLATVDRLIEEPVIPREAIGPRFRRSFPLDGPLQAIVDYMQERSRATLQEIVAATGLAYPAVYNSMCQLLATEKTVKRDASTKPHVWEWIGEEPTNQQQEA